MNYVVEIKKELTYRQMYKWKDGHKVRLTERNTDKCTKGKIKRVMEQMDR